MLLGDDSDELRVGEVTAARLSLAAHLPKDMHHFSYSSIEFGIGIPHLMSAYNFFYI